MSKGLQPVVFPKEPPAALRERGSDLPTQRVRPKEERAGEKPTPKKEEPAEEKVHLTIYMRESVHGELMVKAAQEKTTAQAIILRALRREGLSIKDDDLVDGRRRRGKKK